ncbi:MAG TPA: hypothetical protein VL400_03250 [Polyangiaceae bacterium]|jgi:hypothetical protein|nr:hypothetical protein [Polyangiaceae bacterium]
MSGLSFRIQHLDGRVEEVVVDSDRVLVGSGAHCEIRLPPEAAAVEHVLVTLSGSSVGAEARVFEPPATVNGVPFAQAPLLADAVLGIGGVQIRVAVVEIGNQQNVIRKKNDKTSPMTYVLAAVAVPLSLFILLDDSGQESTSPMPDDRPALFEKVPDTCPQAGAVEAKSLAMSKLRLAESKRERGPFHVEDAVAAVPLFAEASACFRQGGEPAAAKDAGDSADKLKKQLEEDYRARQVRLEHALGVKDLQSAQRETRMLLSMLDGRTGTYVTWLASVERRIELKLGKPEEKT